MKKLLLGFVMTSFSIGAFASTIGISNQPFLMKKDIVTTEYNNYLNNGSGMGLTARYLRKVDESMTAEAGFGFTNGDRASRFFVAADKEILPDFGRQPRLSIKGIAETANNNDERINTFTVAPTLSKGFAFWGKEAFPFIAIPMSVSLNESEREYETSTAIATGITGRIPVNGIKNLVGNIEMNMSLRNSYSALVLGVSLPIE